MAAAKFSKKPLSDKEKQRKVDDFLNMKDTADPSSKKGFYISGMPQCLIDDLHQLSELTGVSLKKICIKILQTEVDKQISKHIN